MGLSGPIGRPARIFVSTWLTEVAATFTRTVPGRISGTGKSASSKFSGPPNALKTSARMRSPCLMSIASSCCLLHKSLPAFGLEPGQHGFADGPAALEERVHAFEIVGIDGAA